MVGMRAYSSDLRERAVRAVESGRPQREVARLFGIGTTAIKRYVRLRQAGESLTPRTSPGRPRLLGPEHEAALRARLRDAPEATLAEHCAWWEQTRGVRLSVATLSRAIRRLGWTRKKGRWQPASATRRRGRPGGRR